MGYTTCRNAAAYGRRFAAQWCRNPRTRRRAAACQHRHAARRGVPHQPAGSEFTVSHLLSTIAATLGGSDLRGLAEQVNIARIAVREACDAVARIDIHPRDYVGRDETRIADVAARRSMITRLREIEEELEHSLGSVTAAQ